MSNDKDKSIIPDGMYCYERLMLKEDGDYEVIGLCSYWSFRNDKHHHENGYCKYLEKGDWEINQEETWTDVETKEKMKGMFSLIWDQVKECGVRDERGESEENEEVKL